ncbi:hypothetical protein ST12_08540 [Clostridium botulinum]|nr:hypothetical protein ST13_08540 [Clostridium botulinum]AJF32791.1 hypothetical protein ST12_08540 [Clostridium botulinum]MBN1035503.1 hypothetical protein [Clostridium botulinum]
MQKSKNIILSLGKINVYITFTEKQIVLKSKLQYIFLYCIKKQQCCKIQQYLFKKMLHFATLFLF